MVPLEGHVLGRGCRLDFLEARRAAGQGIDLAPLLQALAVEVQQHSTADELVGPVVNAEFSGLAAQDLRKRSIVVEDLVRHAPVMTQSSHWLPS